MRAMVLNRLGPINDHSLILSERDVPEPEGRELLIRVLVCGVCRTDLHVIEGDLAREKLPIIPGHQVVGEVVGLGRAAERFKVGERVGIPWLRHTCGSCAFCSAGKENLCEASRYTGYHADGGYAEYALIDENYAYRIPPIFSDEEAAPLLCAGIIGYRALMRSNPRRGGTLAIYGFGSSAHLTFQVAKHLGCEIYVITRGTESQRLAREMGATWTGDASGELPSRVESAIIFAPAGELIPHALRSLEKGGTVSLAGIYMSQIPAMDYESCLFHEKHLTSVEANTRTDGEEFLRIAEAIPIRPRIVPFALTQANEALIALKNAKLSGSAVLRLG